MTRKSYLCFHFLRNWRKRLFLWTLLISSHLNFTTLLEMPILNCLEKNSNARANQSAPKSGRRKFAPNGNASKVNGQNWLISTKRLYGGFRFEWYDHNFDRGVEVELWKIAICHVIYVNVSRWTGIMIKRTSVVSYRISFFLY